MEPRLLRYHEPCLLWLKAKWLLELRCTKRSTLHKGIKSSLLLEKCGGWTAGSRIEHCCLFLIDGGEEVLHGLGTISGFWRLTGGTRLGGTGSRFFRSCDGYSAQCHVGCRDKLTWFCELLGDSSRLSPVLHRLPCGLLVCLVLDSVLFEVRVVQILFQRADEGHRCLFLWVRLEPSG